MQFVVFILGVIIGLLIQRRQDDSSPVKVKVKVVPPKGKTQFLEPVSAKEKFEKAKNISDLL